MPNYVWRFAEFYFFYQQSAILVITSHISLILPEFASWFDSLAFYVLFSGWLFMEPFATFFCGGLNTSFNIFVGSQIFILLSLCEEMRKSVKFFILILGNWRYSCWGDDDGVCWCGCWQLNWCCAFVSSIICKACRGPVWDHSFAFVSFILQNKWINVIMLYSCYVHLEC